MGSLSRRGFVDCKPSHVPGVFDTQTRSSFNSPFLQSKFTFSNNHEMKNYSSHKINTDGENVMSNTKTLYVKSGQ